MTSQLLIIFTSLNGCTLELHSNDTIEKAPL